MAKPRIALVLPYFPPRYYGGAVQVYRALFSNLSDFEVHVIAPSNGALQEDIVANDDKMSPECELHIHRLPHLVFEANTDSKLVSWSKSLAYFLFAGRRLNALLKKLSPDIVINGGTRWVCWMLNDRNLPTCLVNYVHGEEITIPPHGRFVESYVVRQQKKGLRLADANIVVSSFTRELLLSENVAANKIELIPNFVDTDRFRLPKNRHLVRESLGWGEHEFVFLTIARLIARKGIDDAMRALAKLKSEGRLGAKWRYVVGGEGDEKEPLLELARELGLQDNMEFIGYVTDEDLVSHYQAADVFLHPNKNVDGDVEGFGLVFLEANACGAAVIGGRSGGAVDAIEDGVSGFLANAYDPNSVAEKIACYLDNPDLARQHGRQGEQRVRKDFTVQKRRAELTAYLKQLLLKSA
ncbi:MAG: glycosyltransferase family 4 protein [Pseudomonadales bacterium]